MLTSKQYMAIMKEKMEDHPNITEMQYNFNDGVLRPLTVGYLREAVEYAQHNNWVHKAVWIINKHTLININQIFDIPLNANETFLIIDKLYNIPIEIQEDCSGGVYLINTTYPEHSTYGCFISDLII